MRRKDPLPSSVVRTAVVSVTWNLSPVQLRVFILSRLISRAQEKLGTRQTSLLYSLELRMLHRSREYECARIKSGDAQ